MTNRIDQLLSITSALADSNRVRLLLGLSRADCACDVCLCQLTELLQLAPSTVSKHLSILKQAGLVSARKHGRWMYYRVADPEQVDPVVREALRWVGSTLSHDPQLADDARRLHEILQEEPEQLCKRQGQRRACCSSATETPVAARWPKDGRGSSKPTSLPPSPPASSQKE